VLRRNANWLLPVLTAVVVLLAGARLIVVSVRERAEQMRLTAHTVVVRHTAAIAGQLRALAERTRAEAQRAATAAPAAPEPDTFSIDAHGAVTRAAAADQSVASAIASEWAAGGAASHASAPGVFFFGPIRYGSQWIVAASAPTSPRGLEQPQAAAGRQAAEPQQWTVGFEGLDALLAGARFGTLVDEGYDFQLYQSDPRTGRPRVFVSSEPSALAAPAAAGIPQPDLLSAAARGEPDRASGTRGSDFLVLAIRPRTGWYPGRDLATEIGLLALITWAVTFGLYDLTHALKRTRSVLEATRRRLHAANERLTGEIEQRESLQRSFEHARYHDVFTGLPNRRFFMDQLDRALREVRTRRRERIAIVLVDIERFKLIGDTLGHTAGDELLLQAAQRCEQVLGRHEHLLARWGPEQLAVLLHQVQSPIAAQALANQLQEVRDEPFELRQHRISVTSRVGFTCIDSGLQRAEDALREADLALSVAKQHQSQQAVAYAAGMAGAAVTLVSLEADLHVALDRNEFRLLFQPIVDLRRQRVVGAEALLRWRHPVEGLLTPDRFLAIAEEAGVIVPVTRWIIQRVCQLAAEWRQRLPEASEFYISVNLSAAVLRSPGLRDYVARVLQETRLPVGNLKFELSEGGLISNVSTARAVLDAFHDMGIELMLDDFGTGYSSLSYLQLFPFDYVKIDRPFVSRTGSERANNAITAAILQVASNLGLRAVAEVVETKAAAQTLAQMGCEFGQGYFFSAPVEAEVALRHLRTQGAPEESADDDSPTLILPAGMILESRIKDDTGASQEESSPA
jgi:diguanylate cyclase (GGDEF)-like protein